MAPGRDELVQQNVDRAQRTPVPTPEQAAAAKDKTNPKQDPSTPSKVEVQRSDHISLFGSNYSLLKTLEAISFQGGGEMYNAIAYIRYWKRSETADSTTTATPVTQDVPYYKCLPSDFKLNGVDFKTLTNTANAYTVPPGGDTILGQTYDPNKYWTDKSIPNLLPEGYKPDVTFFDTTKTYSFPLDPNKAPSGTRDFNPYTACPPVNGPVKSANPNGGFGGFVRRFLGLSTQPNVVYGGLTTSTKTNTGGTVGLVPNESPVSLPGVWQFLFNPEEIDWEGGPEYGEAETWAVTGEDNAGRPLFWKYMKNQRLTFSKVILNGYLFGKRVDNLEKGLIDLFMKDDSGGSSGSSVENSFGPPVLEFVWGNRIFGPCVIKDVRIKHKNWDNGYLVNAELSFTLEKIPKWVINDGYVDVARPGRQPITGETYNAPATPAPEGDTQQQQTGGSNQQQPQQPSGYTTDQLKRCAYLLRILKDQTLFYYKYDTTRPPNINPNIKTPYADLRASLEAHKTYFDQIINYKAKYYSFWDKYLSYNDQEPWRQDFSKSISAKCQKGDAQFNFSAGEKLKNSISFSTIFGLNSNKDDIPKLKQFGPLLDTYFQRIDSCVTEIRAKTQSAYNSNKCKEINTATNSPRN